MAIVRGVKDLLKEGTEKALKRGKRTEFKELSEVPEDLPAEKVGEFLDRDKSKEFIDVRQKDITLDEKANFAEQSNQRIKIEEEKAKIERLTPKEKTPIPDRKTYLKEEKQTLRYEASQDKLVKLQERERDLYLKADSLKKERARVSEYQKLKEGGATPTESVHGLLNQRAGRGDGVQSIEGRDKAIYNRINAGMFELKESLRTKWLGFTQDKALADDMLRHLHGEKIKNLENEKLVQQISKQWVEASEMIKKLRNRAGARINNLEDWVMPQSHDKTKILRGGYNKWEKGISPKLDRARIEKEQGVSLEKVLQSAYKNIVTPRVETKISGAGSNVAKKGEASRVLHFKTADDRISYNNEFGNPDVFATMDAHIRQQSNEIAMLQLFGANPEATFNKLKELAAADGMGDAKAIYLDTAWKMASGQADGDNIIDGLDFWLATVSGTHRALKIAGSLGTAMVSSLADLSTIFLGSDYRGLSSLKMFGKGLDTLLQEATTVGKVSENIKIANRIGVVSEFASASLTNSRYAEVGTGLAQKAAEVVIRASGLGSYTNSMRAAVGLELAGNFAENFGKKLDDTPFSGLFKEYEISAKDWDLISKSETYKVKGAEFLDVSKIYKLDEQLGYKFSDMMTNEMDSFVTMPTNRTRIWTTWGGKKGSIKGEAARNIMLFKSFPIAITMTHLNRIGKIDSGLGKAAYVGKLATSNFIMGTITLWAYDTVTGKTPREANPAERWQIVPEALMKSGALGIFGDFFMGAAETKYGHTFTDTLLGVPASTLDDIVTTTQDVLIKDISKEKKIAKVYNTAKHYIPGQNLWYTRLLMEKTIGTYMGELIDPDYNKKKRRRRKEMAKRDQEEYFD